jgi:hypothetical protein
VQLKGLCALFAAATTVFMALPCAAQSTDAASGTAPVVVDQGSNWTAAERKDFYSRDQGSQLMPLRWIKALKQADGAPFLADSLGRYGYLPNDWSDPPGLPVGFTVAPSESGEVIGMTCSACHTRQIEVRGTAYRIDGGPAIVDFQSFLADLDKSVNTVLTQPRAFSDFARVVLGPNPTPAHKTLLRKQVAAWFLPYDALMKGSLPTPSWGPSRLDAVSMIFNRLTGLDIGPPPTYIIAANIKPADAPTRYPFLWNAPVQDKTQWPGFADNGNNILGLARNLGEVYGVFGVFHPKKDAWRLLGVDYVAQNSANFSGLGALEDTIRKIGPPKWPWPVDTKLAAVGQAIFARPTERGGCVSCHGIAPGTMKDTWATPVLNVGTDSREVALLSSTVQTGVLQGAKIPLLTSPLKPIDTAFNVLSLSVLGAILQHSIPVQSDEAQVRTESVQSPFRPETEALKGAFSPVVAGSSGAAYESRVLQGIWAAAPYLHNGSVPTLAELLKPAAERIASFKIGPAYDTVNVGLAVEQTKFDYVLQTTGCDNPGSGNSRCGHEFGTGLSPDEKKALLEYLKIL